MNNDTPNKEVIEQFAEQCSIHTVGAAPILASYCHRLGIGQTVNEHTQGKANIDDGTLVLAMVLDVLGGRSPLYRVQKFWSEQDTELLLGRTIDSRELNDDTLGRCLDRIHIAGSMKIFTDVALRAAEIFSLDTTKLNFDTTSINLWGEYAGSTEGGTAPYITYGHSKDKRPDLKQVMFSMLCIEGNIPLLGKIIDGNASDTKVNNEQLQQIASLIKQDRLKDDFLYIADCKLVTQANLEQLGDNAFVTRLPATYQEHDRAIAAALANGQPATWEHIGTLNQTPASKNRPAANYHLSEQSVELYGKSYRAIVVHSSGHDQRCLKKLERQRHKAQQRIEKIISKAQKKTYACQHDAERELQRHIKEERSKLWEISGELQSEAVYAPGRQAANRERPIARTKWTLRLKAQYNEQASEQEQQKAGCFVLLSNAPQSGNGARSAEQLLRAYKEQNGIERNFSFIKEPLIVNDIFLKKPSRIEALGLVFLLALLIWSLLQRIMRQSLAQSHEEQGISIKSNEKVSRAGKHVEDPHRLILKDLDNQPTQRPTCFILMHKFKWAKNIRLHGKRVLPINAFDHDQRQYLRSLHLTPTIFTTCQRQDKPPLH